MYLVAAALLCAAAHRRRGAGGCTDWHRSLPDRPETAMLRVRAEMLWADARRSAMGRGRRTRTLRTRQSRGPASADDLDLRPSRPLWQPVTLWVGPLDTVPSPIDLPHRRGLGPSCGLGQPDRARTAIEASTCTTPTGWSTTSPLWPCGPPSPMVTGSYETHTRLARRALDEAERLHRRRRPEQSRRPLDPGRRPPRAQRARRRPAAADRRPRRLSAHGARPTGRRRSSASRSRWSWLEAATSTRLDRHRPAPSRSRPTTALPRTPPAQARPGGDPLPVGPAVTSKAPSSSSTRSRPRYAPRRNTGSRRPVRRPPRSGRAPPHPGSDRPGQADAGRDRAAGPAGTGPSCNWERSSAADDTLTTGRRTGAGPTDISRVFLDDADHLLVLLRGIAGRCPDDLPVRADCTAPNKAPVSRTANRPPRSSNRSRVRERDLLGHLPAHLSQREIAATMYVSLNTVKSHTAAVYRKLGAASRSQAVRTARLARPPVTRPRVKAS